MGVPSTTNETQDSILENFKTGSLVYEDYFKEYSVQINIKNKWNDNKVYFKRIKVTKGFWRTKEEDAFVYYTWRGMIKKEYELMEGAGERMWGWTSSRSTIKKGSALFELFDKMLMQRALDRLKPAKTKEEVLKEEQDKWRKEKEWIDKYNKNLSPDDPKGGINMAMSYEEVEEWVNKRFEEKHTKSKGADYGEW